MVITCWASENSQLWKEINVLQIMLFDREGMFLTLVCLSEDVFKFK